MAPLRMCRYLHIWTTLFSNCTSVRLMTGACCFSCLQFSPEQEIMMSELNGISKTVDGIEKKMEAISEEVEGIEKVKGGNTNTSRVLNIETIDACVSHMLCFVLVLPTQQHFEFYMYYTNWKLEIMLLTGF